MVSATSGDTMDGVVVSKPFGIDANGNHIDMAYAYDGSEFTLVYNKTVSVYNDTLTKEMNVTLPGEHTPVAYYDEVPIAYPITIDPTWTSMSGCWTYTDGTYNYTMWNSTGSSTVDSTNGSNPC